MSTFDYINMVSGYIINKIENKKDFENLTEINIKPVKDFNNELFYEVKETENFNEQNFYLKFKCASKEEFYSAVNNLLIEYFKNSKNLVSYYCTGPSHNYGCNKFSIVTKNRAQVSFDMHDAQDEFVFRNFQDYLNDEKENTNVLDMEQEETKEEIKTLRKINI